MVNKINFFAFGSDSYYHREWFKKHGFKFNRSTKKWVVYDLPNHKAEEFASYCREFGLNFERSDRDIENFDYVDYLWEGKRDEFMKPFEEKILPTPISQKNNRK